VIEIIDEKQILNIIQGNIFNQKQILDIVDNNHGYVCEDLGHLLTNHEHLL
jgi:hypothetical protein